jgi:hypothetical protein
VTVLISPPVATDALAALLRGDDIAAATAGLAPEALLNRCIEEDLTGLVYERLTSSAPHDSWSAAIRAELSRLARAQTARELVRRREIVSVLDRLAADGVHPILLKGTALAYSVYRNPSSRPRIDTDLLIRREEVGAVRRAMTGLGYDAPPYWDGELLFCQFEMEKLDAFQVDHTFDFHWKIGTQPAFADVLTFDELMAEAVPLPALGVHARGPGTVHALLHACIHPVMHHRHAERLIWLYDIHLLASRLSRPELDRFAHLAATKKVAAATVHSLASASARFDTRIPDLVTARLTDPGAEPSATYLPPRRRWHHELVSSLHDLPRGIDRVRLIREVLFPNPRYMLNAYGFRNAYSPLLPALYVHRILRGGWNVMVGRK